ncbi:MAG TPA: carboxypeptidase-like regulatory domain-containing protein [Polyangia bacterium]|nr:carboxypeptidase-like regulatory domain-containing protein [Polyangia bacterium]
MASSETTTRQFLAALTVAALAAALAPGALGCRRSPDQSAAPNAATATSAVVDVRCVERPEGCIWCEGRGPATPPVEADSPPASLCDPKDPGECVDFCSQLTPECAVKWHAGPSCLLPSEQEFRRELFRRDTADRPEATVQGRVMDEAGKRVEGAKIRAWFQGTAILDETSGKDGSFRLKLPAGPWSYSIRVSHVGFAAEVSDLKLDRAGSVTRAFRMAPENMTRGRVVDNKAIPVGGVTIIALRNPDDSIESGSAVTGDDGNFTLGGLEAKRYYLRASKFGWLPNTLKSVVVTPAVTPPPRVTIKLTRTGVIKGRVIDTDGDGKPGATVVALLSGGGVTSSPIIWTADSEGEFAQDRFGKGTYYLWARHGEMLVYPPVKIEIEEASLAAAIELKLSHRGARVRGQLSAARGGRLAQETRAVLLGRSPLALPRKAVGEIDAQGRFVVTGVLPGRYELTVRVGPKLLPILSGPREVEIPIEAGATVDLSEAVTVRPQTEE